MHLPCPCEPAYTAPMVQPLRSEKAKMLAGEPYAPTDPELTAERHRAQRLCAELAGVDPADASRRRALVEQLLGRASDAEITPPFHCDYGHNLLLGSGVYFNVGCVVLDVATVTVGDRVLFGPGVQLYTPVHPMNAAERRSGVEFGRPVTIGDDVWIGGNAVVCPGVTVGEGSVIGAGSVVTRDIPAHVFAAGNPCRVIRPLDGNI